MEGDAKSPVEVMPFLARWSARLLVGLKTAALVFLPAATGAGIVTTYIPGTRLQYGWGNEKIGNGRKDGFDAWLGGGQLDLSDSVP